MPKFVLIFYIYSSNHSLLHFLALDIQIKECFGFNILSCNPFYILYLLLITVHQPALGLTLDINKEKYTKLSVVLLFFPVVLRVANFLLSLFCSIVSLLCRKPVVWMFSTNYARSFLYYSSLFGGGVFVLFCLFYHFSLC